MERGSWNAIATTIRSLDPSTLASLEIFDQQDATLAFALSRNAALPLPSDLPAGDARERLSELFACGIFRSSTARPPPGPAPSAWRGQEDVCPASLLLATAVLRAGSRAEGFSPLGALVAGSGVLSAPCPALLWSRAALWLGSHCAGSIRGADFRFISFTAQLARCLGLFLSSPPTLLRLGGLAGPHQRPSFRGEARFTHRHPTLPLPPRGRCGFYFRPHRTDMGARRLFRNVRKVCFIDSRSMRPLPPSEPLLGAALACGRAPSAEAMTIFDSMNHTNGMWRPTMGRRPHDFKTRPDAQPRPPHITFGRERDKERSPPRSTWEGLSRG